jgi:hypothetical protein
MKQPTIAPTLLCFGFGSPFALCVFTVPRTGPNSAGFSRQPLA